MSALETESFSGRGRGSYNLVFPYVSEERWRLGVTFGFTSTTCPLKDKRGFSKDIQEGGKLTTA